MISLMHIKKNPTFKPKHKTELIICPTTCGTGSEVTNISMIYLTKTKTKKAALMMNYLQITQC